MPLGPDPGPYRLVGLSSRRMVGYESGSGECCFEGNLRVVGRPLLRLQSIGRMCGLLRRSYGSGELLWPALLSRLLTRRSRAFWSSRGQGR